MSLPFVNDKRDRWQYSHRLGSYHKEVIERQEGKDGVRVWDGLGHRR